jgi:hypothetical protein
LKYTLHAVEFALDLLVEVEMDRTPRFTTGGGGVKTIFQPVRLTAFMVVWRARMFIVVCLW